MVSGTGLEMGKSETGGTGVVVVVLRGAGNVEGVGNVVVVLRGSGIESPVVSCTVLATKCCTE